MNNENIQLADFYLLRMPLMPLDFFFQLSTNVSGDEQVERIKIILQDPIVREAIFIASPLLIAEYDNLIAGKIKDERKCKKILKSLYRYCIRMSTRSTPYGMFAGCSVGTPGQHTAIEINQVDPFRKYCRLDMYYVAELVQYINGLPWVNEKINFFPNNSIYVVGSKVRFIEFSTSNKKRSYRLSSLDMTPYVDCILQKAQRGVVKNDLCKHLMIFDNDLSEDECLDFIDQLIGMQLLVSELEPTLTGKEFFYRLTEKLIKIDKTHEVTKILMQVTLLLKSDVDGIAKYEQITELISKVIAGTSSKDLIQVDMFWNCAQNNIDKNWLTEAAKQINQLFGLSEKYVIEDVEEFKKQFVRRYENQEVSLVDALDPDTGIGYAAYAPGTADVNPLGDSINIASKEPLQIKWNAMMRLMFSKYTNAIRNKDSEIIIEEKDIESIAKTKTNMKLPDQFYIMGNLIKEQGQLNLILQNVMGPSACELMGRFCNGDKVLNEKVISLFEKEKEKYPDTIFAEVIHLPPDRVGNILLRPVLREYEIPFLGQSSVDENYQITIQDLVVSVEEKEIVLKSKRLGKRVIPKLTSAHNYAIKNLSIYKFLCDIQYQNLNMGFNWNWGVLATEPFLPRVRFKNLILHKAQWNLKLADFSIPAGHATIDSIQVFREKIDSLGLPQYISIEEADNVLPIDWKNDLSLELLMDHLQKKKNIIVSEFLQNSQNSVAMKNGMSFCQEVIIPFTTQEKALSNFYPTLAPPTENLKRDFYVGDEWLYYKLFCGTKTGEVILRDFLPLLVAELENNSHIDKWFFVRYFDPEPHIRLRLHLISDKSIPSAINIVRHHLTEFIEQKWIHRIEVDTYKQELERYSTELMAFSESVFFHDSVLITEVINLIDKEETESKRWMFALLGIDTLLNDFGFELASKVAFMHDLAESFFLEFGGSESLRHHLNDQNRRDKLHIKAAFEMQESGILLSLEKRSLALSKLIRKEIIAEPDTLSRYFPLSSYIHMFCNRLFLSNHRKNELVLYHYLHKYYKSKLVQENSTNNKIEKPQMNITKEWAHT